MADASAARKAEMTVAWTAVRTAAWMAWTWVGMKAALLAERWAAHWAHWKAESMVASRAVRWAVHLAVWTARMSAGNWVAALVDPKVPKTAVHLAERMVGWSVD